MKRNDYIEIKDTFNIFIEAWKTNTPEALSECFVPETACHLSVVSKYPCGSQHGIIGIKDFVKKTVKPDFFYINPCNFVARVKDKYAKQSATLVCRAGVIENDNVRVIEFSFLTVNSWIKTKDGWKMNDFKMDVVECSGDYNEFIDGWYFENNDLNYYFGIHLPVISGELDCPWEEVKEEDDIKDDQTKILETFSRYAYGIDTLNFTQLIDSLSDDLVVNMAPWGAMDKREFMQTLKFKRQASNTWNHPTQLDDIKIDNNNATVRLHRMAGHKQSTMPIEFTKDNYNAIYADARYELKMIKEDGNWKILRMDYFLGIIDLGIFE
ncbi:nuclear transport factor 2 family protein [Breznakia pachnodae]|uniref:SnoaL-like domain-containing protein n=1 Tax=Breznakia pachnodae TaxID=265178 RepID=A0ABU0E8D5_9FIRM|nr:nuclear transport factor 2 family protein [Breznakia pachnodae]MDQ0362750.1 hypothetical protein [Breznakia pachnodae]